MNGLVLFFAVVLVYVLMAASSQQSKGGKGGSRQRTSSGYGPGNGQNAPSSNQNIFEQMQMPADELFQTQTSRNQNPEEAGSGSLMEAFARGIKDPAVYSGGDASSSLGSRLKKELQMAEHRQKLAGFRAEEQRRAQADENARKQAAARARLEEKKSQLEEYKKKKEAAEREKSIGKARDNATDSPEEAAAHAHAAGGCPEGTLMEHTHGEEIDISDCLEKVEHVMICGPDTTLAFERDFLGEGSAMVANALSGLQTSWNQGVWQTHQ